jgi:hypothetical protein
VRRRVLLVVDESAFPGAHFPCELEDGRRLLGDRLVVGLLLAGADVAVGLEVGGRREVDEEREQRADEGEQPREGEVPPGPARGDGAVGERGLRVREHVDERGGEDDPRSVALDEEQPPRVRRAAPERPRQRDGEADADGAGHEDGEQGPRLEPRSRRAVAAGAGEGRHVAGGEAARARHGVGGGGAKCSTKVHARATATGRRAAGAVVDGKTEMRVVKCLTASLK